MKSYIYFLKTFKSLKSELLRTIFVKKKNKKSSLKIATMKVNFTSVINFPILKNEKIENKKSMKT